MLFFQKCVLLSLLFLLRIILCFIKHFKIHISINNAYSIRNFYYVKSKIKTAFASIYIFLEIYSRSKLQSYCFDCTFTVSKKKQK